MRNPGTYWRILLRLGLRIHTDCLDGQIPRQLARSQGYLTKVVVGKHMKKIYSDLKDKEQELYAGAKGEAG